MRATASRAMRVSRSGSAHASSECASWRVRLVGSRVSFDQSDPFRNEHGFNPDVVAGKCLPNLQRHAQFAKTSKEGRVNRERRWGTRTALRSDLEDGLVTCRPAQELRRHQANQLRDLGEAAVQMRRRVATKDRTHAKLEGIDQPEGVETIRGKSGARADPRYRHLQQGVFYQRHVHPHPE
jgi:hypothetical protein